MGSEGVTGDCEVSLSPLQMIYHSEAVGCSAFP